MSGGLLRATFTLLAGGVVAQALPLLLGPWLTRLFSPQDFGQFVLFAALAANLSVIACARYDFALPMAQSDSEARDLMALCARVLLLMTALSVLLSVGLHLGPQWPHMQWLPLAVFSAGLVQCLTMWATRARRFSSLALARVTHHGGGALAQAAGGLLGAGSQGLVLGPVFAALVAALGLRKPRPLGGWTGLWRVPASAMRSVAIKHRDFPILNTPHAFAGALQDTLAVVLIAAWAGDVSAGFWGLALRYLKAPASLIGGAVSQALYPQLSQEQDPLQARRAVRQVMRTLALIALPLMLGLLLAGPAIFALLFGEPWREAGELARALSPYIAVHFVASPLGVVTLAWRAQGWALRLALVGHLLFLVALGLGLLWGGLMGAAWSVSAVMCLYFGYYFWSLARWKEIPDVATRAA